jgi:hypothetical protein
VLLPEPGDAMLAGAKLAVIPLGTPLTARLTAALKLVLAVVVKVTLPRLPAATVSELGETASVKVGGTSRVTVLVAVLVIPPPAAVMVMV